MVVASTSNKLPSYEEIVASDKTEDVEGIPAYEDIGSTKIDDLFSRGYLTSLDEEIKEADDDFKLSMDTLIPTSHLQAFGKYRPTRKRPMIKTANKLASRFSDQLHNNTVSAIVRTLTDGDGSAANDRAHQLIIEWEKEKGLKLDDEGYEEQLAEWTQQLYEDPKYRIDFLKDEPQFNVPEKVASYFDPRQVDKSENWVETSIDAAAGIIGFGAELAVFNKAFPGVPKAVAWETVSIANGGKPGSGSSMYGAMGLVGKAFPATKPILSKLGGGAGTGAIFGATTYLAGGTTEEIIINSGIPVLLGFMSITNTEWDSLKPKSKLELIRSVKRAVPQLENVTTKQMEQGISNALVAKEVAGIRKLGKKTGPKPTAAVEVGKGTGSFKPIESGGKRVESQHAKTLEARAILEGVIGKEGVANLATHEVAGRIKQAAKARDIPPKDAISIVIGEKPLPDGVLMADVYVAASRRARAQGDAGTLARLISSNKATDVITRSAQELNAMANQQKYDPVKLGADVVEARGVIPDKKLAKDLSKAERKLDKAQVKLSKKEIDLTIASILEKPKSTRAVDIASKTFGTRNRLVTKTMADAALKRIGGKGKLFAGIDPKNFADVVEVSAYYLEAVGRNLPVWSKAMTAQFGEKVKPFLKDLWEKANIRLNTGVQEKSISGLASTFQKKSAILGQTKMIRSLQESLIRSGFKTRQPLLKEMHRILRQIDPSITERQTMDAMSGAGKFKLLNKDEIQVIRRDINNQYQQVAKLQDMAAGKAPSSTGYERQSPSAEGRKLIKQVNEAKKKGGFESVSPEKELKSTLNSIKTRLTNRIADLKEQLKTGKKLVKEKAKQPSDAETTRLTNEKNALQKEFDEMFGPRALTVEQRINMAEKSLQRTIGELDRRIKENDLAPKAKAPKLSTPELEALRSRKTALAEELQNMKDMANPKKTPQEVALQSYKTRLANEKAKYDEMMAAGDFEKPVKKERVMDKEAEKLLAARDTAARTVRVARELQKQKGGIATEEILRINDLSNEIETAKTRLEADPKNKQRHIDHGNAILDFEEYSVTLVPRPNTWRTVALDVAGTPRTLMTSLDISFPLRQGWGSMATKEFWKGFGEQFKYAWDEKNLRTLMAEIKGSPRFKWAKQDGLRLTDLGSRLELREEGIQSTFADRIPIVGRYIRGSQRAYTGMANYIRWNRYNNMIDAAIMQGRPVTGAEGLAMRRDIATVINIFTGSGNLGTSDKYGNVSPAVNQLLFSARKLSADINMMDPRLYVGAGKYTKLNPFARKMAQRQLVGSLAMTSTILGLAAMSGLDVELNPTSGNFGKLQIGNRFLDITGGKASLLAFVSRAISGKIKSTGTDEIEDITPYLRKELLFRFGRGKLAPMASLIADVYLQVDYKGDPVATPKEISKAVLSRFYPMAISDAIDLMENDVDGDIITKLLIDASFAGAAIFGAGAQVHEDKDIGTQNF